MHLLTIDERVDNGAGLLDQYGPHDWRERIDPARLDIDTGTNCVIGQLYGDWEQGLAELELRDWSDDATFYGLYPAEDGDGEALTASWRSLLLGTRTPGRRAPATDESALQPWQCAEQTAYGLPWDEYCTAPKGEGDDYCPEHRRHLAEQRVR